MKRYFLALLSLLLCADAFARPPNPCGDAKGDALRYIRTTPYETNGVRGFKVLQVEARQFWDQLGVKKGDILVELAGRKVSSRPFEVIASVCGHPAWVVVRRGNKRILLGTSPARGN